MKTHSADTEGAIFREGTTLLHRLDPRTKLLLVLVLIVGLFASPGPPRLWFLTTLATLGFLMCRFSPRVLLRRFLALRWLLLASVALHLLLTPGRTLFGLEWLSYDGLLRGITIDLQLLLALGFSTLLGLTTSPSALAWALTRLLAPLSRFGVPVQESGGLLLLVLDFLPVIRTEFSVVLAQGPARGPVERIRSVTERVGGVILRLVERADRLAVERVLKGDDVCQGGFLQLSTMGIGEKVFVAGILPLVMLWWLL